MIEVQRKAGGDPVVVLNGEPVGRVVEAIGPIGSLPVEP